eukprot:5760348-Pleurochrysis_carterae.AAC.1
MRCAAARANTALPPSPASLVVAVSQVAIDVAFAAASSLDLIRLPQRHPLLDVSSPLDVGMPTQ